MIGSGVDHVVFFADSEDPDWVFVVRRERLSYFAMFNHSHSGFTSCHNDQITNSSLRHGQLSINRLYMLIDSHRLGDHLHNFKVAAHHYDQPTGKRNVNNVKHMKFDSDNLAYTRVVDLFDSERLEQRCMHRVEVCDVWVGRLWLEG